MIARYEDLAPVQNTVHIDPVNDVVSNTRYHNASKFGIGKSSGNVNETLETSSEHSHS